MQKSNIVKGTDMHSKLEAALCLMTVSTDDQEQRNISMLINYMSLWGLIDYVLIDQRFTKTYDCGFATGTGKSTTPNEPARIKTHVEMAAEIFKCTEEEVTEDQRQAVKRACYLEMYSNKKSMIDKGNHAMQMNFDAVKARVLAWAASNEEELRNEK